MTARWTSTQLRAHQERRLGEKAKRQKTPPESANRITSNIVRVVNMQPGCAAYRINNVGVYDEAKGVHRRASTQKGIADVAAIIRGRACWIEVKAGLDKMSREQLIFKQEVELAGGLFFEARSTDEFLNWFTQILKTI